MLPRLVLAPALLAVAVLLAGCEYEELTPEELEAREAEEEARMNLANAKALEALQGTEIQQLANLLAEEHRAEAKAAAERAVKMQQQEEEARRRQEEENQRREATGVRRHKEEEAAPTATVVVPAVIPAVIRIVGATGPNNATLNGMFLLQELRAPGEAPDYRKVENHDRWIYQGSEGRWWLATQDLAIKREGKGWMRSVAASPQGKLPSFHVPWDVFDGKQWEKQELEIELLTPDAQQIRDL